MRKSFVVRMITNITTFHNLNSAAGTVVCACRDRFRETAAHSRLSGPDLGPVRISATPQIGPPFSPQPSTFRLCVYGSYVLLGISNRLGFLSFGRHLFDLLAVVIVNPVSGAFSSVCTKKVVAKTGVAEIQDRQVSLAINLQQITGKTSKGYYRKPYSFKAFSQSGHCGHFVHVLLTFSPQR